MVNFVRRTFFPYVTGTLTALGIMYMLMPNINDVLRVGAITMGCYLLMAMFVVLVE